MVRARHSIAMERALVAIGQAEGRLPALRTGAEFVAADLWAAIRALDLLVGKIDVETLLDEIFSSFCIGK